MVEIGCHQSETVTNSIVQGYNNIPDTEITLAFYLSAIQCSHTYQLIDTKAQNPLYLPDFLLHYATATQHRMKK